MINFTAPLNTLSFGFVTWNILFELFKRESSFNYFPTNGQLDFSAYNRMSEEFKNFIVLKSRFAREKYSRNDHEVKLWHIQQSEAAIGKKVTLFTFHELDSLTPVERNILSNQDNILVSSKYTKEVFETNFVNVPVTYCPLGFDKQNFYKIDKTFYPDKRLVFSVFGKFEKRKGHEKVIKAWIKRFGKNRSYMLHAHIYNPFYTPEENVAIRGMLCDRQQPFNVSFPPFVGTLQEFNECINAANIVIDMSGGEGFSLPSFHALGLGKHGVIHNCSAMKDWANDKNAVLVPSSGKIEAYDNKFFMAGGDYNQGNIFDFDADAFIDACEKAESRFISNPVNKEGLKLVDKFSWSDTVDTILKIAE